MTASKGLEAGGFQYKDGQSVAFAGRFGMVEVRYRKPYRNAKADKPFTAYLRNAEGLFEYADTDPERAAIGVYAQYGRYHAFKDLESQGEGESLGAKLSALSA